MCYRCVDKGAYMDITKIDITNWDKIELLQSLINNADCLGINNQLLKTTTSKLDRISYDEAQRIWDSMNSHYFDYYESRPLKVDLTGNILDARLYVRDNSSSTLKIVISECRPGPKNKLDTVIKVCTHWGIIRANLALKNYRKVIKHRIPNCPATKCTFYKECQNQR